MEDVMAATIREAFRASSHRPEEADHLLPPTGRLRDAAMRAAALARMERTASIDLLPLIGNPAGAANLLQVATSAVLLAAGHFRGPGAVLTTGIEGTASAVVMSRPRGSA